MAKQEDTAKQSQRGKILVPGQKGGHCEELNRAKQCLPKGSLK